MDPVEVHLAQVLAAVRPLAPARYGLEAAEGCVLAEDTRAALALPSFDNSAMDGYAVHAADIAAATAEDPVSLPVADEVTAGDTRQLTVEPGSCVIIMTGALMPGGADTVIPVEWTDGGRETAQFHRAAPAGNSVRRRGVDVAVGDLLLPAGTRLGPAQIALLAAGGNAHPLVRRAPVAAVIATGSELVEPGQDLAPGQIWDSNSYLIAAAVRRSGGMARRHRVPDDPVAMLGALEAQAPLCDLLITTGGVSMGGQHDVVKASLSGWDDVTFRKVAMQPGMPQGFGVIGERRTPLFALPGNPVSAFVSFHLFVRPALDALRGLTATTPVLRATLTDGVRSPSGKRSYLRGTLDLAARTVTPLNGQDSHRLGTLAHATALIIVGETVTELAAGAETDVISLP